jgi:tRNA threonylcarbamoyl adenosine modification protein YeaZ
MLMLVDSTTNKLTVAVKVANLTNDSCLRRNDDSIYVKSEITSSQSVRLPIIAEELLKAKGISFKDISAIAVVVGPGSFTGIRIGIAWAKGVAVALNIPIIPINRFQVALLSRPDSLIAIDNNKDGYFCAAANLEPTLILNDDFEKLKSEYADVVMNPEFNIDDAFMIMQNKIGCDAEPVIPLYLRGHYAEKTEC